jgi:hypothetical protein
MKISYLFHVLAILSPVGIAGETRARAAVAID